MQQINLTVNGTSKIMCYANTLDDARQVATRQGIALNVDGTATMQAMGGKVKVGTWTATTVTIPDGSVAVTWTGPDATTSAIVTTKKLASWLSDQLVFLLRARPDMARPADPLGAWINPAQLTIGEAVYAIYAQAAAPLMASHLLAGGDITLGDNLLAVTQTPNT